MEIFVSNFSYFFSFETQWVHSNTAVHWKLTYNAYNLVTKFTVQSSVSQRVFALLSVIASLHASSLVALKLVNLEEMC